MLRKRNPPTSHLDAQLFLVRHLLILKEITQNLDLVQKDVDPSINFTSVTGMFICQRNERCLTQYTYADTLASMLSRTTSLLPDALFATLGMPRSEDTIREAKHVRSFPT